ncbi:hypothetical protein DVH24_041893 [Malus domestica]|uniref:Uncharacterized protein n=1 Tax=Malus domestica TaxID=3750 RepID=A0A498ISJ9_MALDO|nr:hypothetical protein DVH24_041893 [Malus domestica]
MLADAWAIENFASVAKCLSGQIIGQKNTLVLMILMLHDLFSSGAIKSARGFQVYKEVVGLSGLNYAYTDNTAVYHTKVFLFPFSSLFGILVTKSVWSISVKLTGGVSNLHEFYYRLQVNPTIPKYKRNKDWR